MIRRALLLLAAAAALAGAEAAPVLPGGVVELHGRFQAEGTAAPAPFWLRIGLPDPALSGGRRLELVWEPPPAAALGGAVLGDCPFALLDAQARLLAWDGRDGIASVASSAREYRVVRTLHEGASDDLREVPGERTLPGPRAWERRTAPLLLAATWRAGGSGRVGVLDLFGDAPPAELAWEDRQVRFAGQAWQAEAAADGRLQRLSAADGRVLLAIDTP